MIHKEALSAPLRTASGSSISSSIARWAKKPVSEKCIDGWRSHNSHVDFAAVQPRRVAVSIPYSIEADGTKLVCLVSSRKHDNRFVLPKGGVENGETGRQAAIREMWEEAGLRPIQQEADPSSSQSIIATIADHKSHKASKVDDPKSKDFVPRAIYEAHEILVAKGDAVSELSEWPEKDERIRKWASLQEALELISWRKDIHQLLLASSIATSSV